MNTVYTFRAGYGRNALYGLGLDAWQATLRAFRGDIHKANRFVDRTRTGQWRYSVDRHECIVYAINDTAIGTMTKDSR